MNEALQHTQTLPPIPVGATITVYDGDGVTLSTGLTNSNGDALANPFVTADGNIYFRAATGMHYMTVQAEGWNGGDPHTFGPLCFTDSDIINALLAATTGTRFVTDTDLAGYIKVGDQLPAGSVNTFYLDDSVTIADNSALSPTPSTYPETFESVSVDSDINGGIGFLERFISGPLGITSIPAGSWVFHSYAQASAVTGDNHIVTRINRRKRMDGMTGTFTGAGATRTFTVTGGAPFVPGDATASILTASLIETPTQTAWISGYTSASEVTVTLTNPAFVNVADTPLNALYYLLFSNQSDDIASAGSVVELENTSVQGAFAVDPTDRIVAAYFAKTTSNLARNISLYHGGTTRYSHIETPLVTDISSTLTARGDLLYRGANGLDRLPKGTVGQVLTMGADDPAWADSASGGGATPIALDVSLGSGGSSLVTVASDLVATYPLAADEEYFLEVNATLAAQTFGVRLNGRSGASDYGHNNGGTSSLNAATSLIIGTTASNASTVFIQSHIRLSRGLNGFPTFRNETVSRGVTTFGAAGSGSAFFGAGVMVYNEAIDSISLYATSGNFSAGGTVNVYRRKKQ